MTVIFRRSYCDEIAPNIKKSISLNDVINSERQVYVADAACNVYQIVGSHIIDARGNSHPVSRIDEYGRLRPRSNTSSKPSEPLICVIKNVNTYRSAFSAIRKGHTGNRHPAELCPIEVSRGGKTYSTIISEEVCDYVFRA